MSCLASDQRQQQEPGYILAAPAAPCASFIECGRRCARSLSSASAVIEVARSHWSITPVNCYQLSVSMKPCWLQLRGRPTSHHEPSHRCMQVLCCSKSMQVMSNGASVPASRHYKFRLSRQQNARRMLQLMWLSCCLHLMSESVNTYLLMISAQKKA